LPESIDVIEKAVREQVEISIAESDLIVLMVDSKTGITVTDSQLAKLLLNADKNVLLAVNKVDDGRDDLEVGQFYNLGLGEPVPVSAMTGRQTGDFLDKVKERLKSHVVTEHEDNAIKLAVIGKENVGKSSLVNTLLSRERQIVTEVPGTTRDSIDSKLKYKNHDYVLIDTAGLKKKAKVKENILFYSNLRTYRSINRCDVVLYMVSAPDNLTKQDLHVLMDAAKEKKGIICIFNKWDLVEKDHKTMENLKKDIKAQLGDLRYIPLIFTSVSEKQRLYKMLDLATRIYIERQKRIPTSELNAFFSPLLSNTTPPAVRGKEIKINYVTQIKSNPPLFAFYSNFPELIAEHYKRFIENKLREQFGFSGVPLTLSFRKK